MLQGPPGGTAFKPVGLFVAQRCGTLDCHGQVGRDLRIYGKQGLRLNPMDAPGGILTTAAELDADYQSICALEPEKMSLVAANNAMAPYTPDTLTFYRKPTGLEAHKGGMLIQIGDDQDKCITSWLQGTVDTTACANAINYNKYP
jgi:hypothetical protein